MFKTKILYLVVTVCLLKNRDVESHGRLLNPPARSTCWREFGTKCYTEYTDNQMFCGGRDVQWLQNGGKCGICGDNWAGPRRFERGGVGYTGHIVRSYLSGQTIKVNVQITANHLGWFEFRICNVDNMHEATQECLDQNLLKDTNGNTRTNVYSGQFNFEISLVLPSGLSCNRCVFQWKYNTGNSWGVDPVTGQQGLGFGPQEQFYGCSDVSIGASSSNSDNFLPTQSSTRTSTRIQPITSTIKSQSTTTFFPPVVTGSLCYNGDGYYPDLASGCKKFYRCVNGVVYTFECGTGTLFDKSAMTCNHAILVNCV